MHPRLKKRRDFILVATQGLFCATGTVIVQYLDHLKKTPSSIDQEDLSKAECPPQNVRVGYTASRRVGNAVHRNRAKRRLREAFRIVASRLNIASCDVVLVAKVATTTCDFATLLRDLTYALNKCKKGEAHESKPFEKRRKKK